MPVPVTGQEQDQNMKTSKRLLLLSMLSALPVTASAADAGAGDTSQWKCEGCASEQGWSGSADLGVGGVSDKSTKFGEYTGLNKQGGFFIGDAATRFRSAGAYY